MSVFPEEGQSQNELCVNKSQNQCRKGWWRVSLCDSFTGCFEGRSKFTQRKMCKLEWSSDQGASLSALNLKSFASLLKWCAAHYTCHMSLRDLYGLCVNARTDSGKSLAVWMNQNQTIPGWFPEHITHVFSGISVWKRLIGLRMRTGWSSLRNKLFIMLFEQKKQHLWHSCCLNSLVISNMKFNRKLSEQFWRIWCFPIQSDRSCTWMPERRFKDGRRVTWLVLKRLWFSSLKTRSKRIIWISEFSTREQLQSDHSNSWMNRLLRFANRFNRFIENNQFVHESDTASASRSTWCIIRSNDMFYEM